MTKMKNAFGGMVIMRKTEKITVHYYWCSTLFKIPCLADYIMRKNRIADC